MRWKLLATSRQHSKPEGLRILWPTTSSNNCYNAIADGLTSVNRGGTPWQPAFTIRGTHHDGAGRDPAAWLDAGTPDHDAVLFVQKVSAASRRLDLAQNGSVSTNYVRFVSSSSFWPSVQTTLIIVGGVLAITVVLGVAAGPPARSTDVGAGRRPHPGHRPLLRDADSFGAGLEEYVHGPGQRHPRAPLEVLRCNAGRMAEPGLRANRLS